jgi:hypothetical protein
MKHAKYPTRVLVILLATMFLLIAAHLLMQHLNLSYNEKQGQIFEISNRFDVDDEASIPTWFAQAIWVGVAVLSALAVRLSAAKRDRRLWKVLAIVGIIFAIDEVSGIHELSLQSLHLAFFGLEQSSSRINAWWLVMPLILGLGIWFLRGLYDVLSHKNWLIMVIGWATFMAGATGFELIGNDIAHNTYLYQGVFVAIEEGLEMLGGILVLFALLRHLDSKHANEIKQAWQKLR